MDVRIIIIYWRLKVNYFVCFLFVYYWALIVNRRARWKPQFFFCSYQISVEIIVYIFIVSSLLLYYLSSLYSVITCNIVSCAFFDKKKNGIDSSILQTKLVSFAVKCQLKLSLLIMRHLWEGLIWNLYNDTSIYSMIFRRACG